jgi:type IV pilus assembly protein PilO
MFGTRQLIFVGVLLTVPLGAYFMVFKPQNTEIGKAKAEIEVKEKLLTQLREATAVNADLERANADIRKSIETIEARLPSDKEVDTVLRDVAQIASRNGLRIPQFKKSDNRAPAGIAQEQPLDVEITGDFDGFYQFLLDLEKLPRITRIPDFKISRAEDNDGAMKANFVLSIYYQGTSAGSEQ